MYGMFYVRSSPCPAPNLQSSPPLHAACTAIARCLPLPGPKLAQHRMPSLRISAVGVGVQPAAELQHLQRHGHAPHVLRALLPVPCPQPAVEPSSLHAACTAVARRPPGPPHLAPHTVTACPPTRQQANSLSNANKLLIRCAWAGTSAFASAGYGSSWGPGTCPATFTTTASLKTAVQAFNANPTAATAEYGPLADWDVSGITDMSYLFKDLKDFNADVSNWDTSSVTNMYQMFYDAAAFNQPLSLDTSSVTTMQYMFLVRSYPCLAPNLQSSSPLHAACTSRVAPRSAPYALRSTLGSTRRRSTSR